MATKEDYARWITANQDKVGTPEFLTVAAAYRQSGIDERIGQSRADEEAFRASANPTNDMSGAQKFLAGTGKGMTDMFRGVGQLLGVVDESDIDASKQRDAPLMETGAGMAGNITGAVATAAPAAFIPGVNSYLGATLLGTATGAMQPVGSEDSRLQNTVVGGAAGAAGQGLANALSRMLNPQTSKAVTELMDEGVTPTPGQILGGFPKKVESALESWPYLGPAIMRGKERAIGEFNESVLNKALAPIGKTVTATGREGIDQAHTMLSQHFDDVLARVQQASPDLQFDMDMQRILQGSGELARDKVPQLETLMKNRVIDKLAGQTSGRQLQNIHSDLLRLSRDFGRSADPDQRTMSKMFSEAGDAVLNLVERVDPSVKADLQAAKTGWAMLMRAERASLNAQDGVFTPSQLATAVRTLDPSRNKSSFARGNALLQDTAEGAQSVLQGGIRNSGTADRAALIAALSGKAGLGDVAATLVTGGAYTSPGQKALAALLARRPNIMRQAGDIVSRSAPISALTAAEAAQ